MTAEGFAQARALAIQLRVHWQPSHLILSSDLQIFERISQGFQILCERMITQELPGDVAVEQQDPSLPNRCHGHSRGVLS